MNSLRHDELVELLCRAPDVVVELLRSAGDVVVPEFDRIEVAPGDLRELVPPERHVDVVVLLHRDTPVLAILVEVQASQDPDKLFTWPFYQTAVRARHRCPTCLLVYALDDRVARWADAPIDTGQPNSSFRPLVIDDDDFPRVTSVEEAHRGPHRAILSALVHAAEPGAERIAHAAMQGAVDLGESERSMWLELIAVALNEASRKALEKMMNIQDFEHRSVWAKKARVEVLDHLFSLKFGRALTEAEVAMLSRRIEADGAVKVTDAAYGLDGAALEAWLHEGTGEV